MDRRKFIRNSSLAAAAVNFDPFPYPIFAPDKPKYASDRIKLGSEGLEVSRLAMGTGSNGWNKASNQTRKLGIKGLSDLLQAAYEQGVFFWDSADQYGTHPHLKEALKHISREKVVILTKTHASTEKEMQEDLDRFRSEIGTDYIDIMLLHCMIDPNWPERKKGAMEYLSKGKQNQWIKMHGVSCHSLGALKTAAETDWVEVDLARINPAGAEMDSDVQTVVQVLKSMKNKGKAIIGMKILGAGSLRNRVDECLKFALAQDFIDCFTIGSESYEQFSDLVKRIPAVSARG